MSSPAEHILDPTGSVTEQIANAGRVHRDLEGEGMQVRFLTDVHGARRVELRERDGDFVRELSIAEAFDLAAGSIAA